MTLLKPEELPDSVAFESAQAQREQAMACMILAGSIALALFFSVFGPSREITAARAGVEVHRKLAEESAANLELNRWVLYDAQKSLEAIRANARK